MGDDRGGFGVGVRVGEVGKGLEGGEVDAERALAAFADPLAVERERERRRELRSELC